jgi:hypothetical protein
MYAVPGPRFLAHTFNQPYTLSPLPSQLFPNASSQAASSYALDKRYGLPLHLYIFIS